MVLLASLLCAAAAAATLPATSSAFAPPTGLGSATTPARPPAGVSLRASSTLVTLGDGLTKTVTKPGNGVPLRLGDVATVKYSCYVPGGEATTTAPFARSEEQKVVVGDGVMIRGWEEALRTMEVGERATVRITDAEAYGYGAAGVPPFVPPGAEIEMELQVLDAEEGVDMSMLATSDPLKPRTPGAIAAAYKTRQDRAAFLESTTEQKEGLEALIEKAKSFYFFGFFEGETGQAAPWYLRPSITFPLAFLIVGAAFYVSYLGGAISERGAQVRDELDEIIVMNDALRGGMVLALASLPDSPVGF